MDVPVQSAEAAELEGKDSRIHGLETSITHQET